MKRRQLWIIAVSLFIATSLSYGKTRQTIRTTILNEIKKYPKMEIQDLYKLAYLAAMGNEHIMSDTVAMHKYLEDELTTIDSSSREPLFEYLSTDSTIARVNLRVFKAQKGNPTTLVEAMVKTALIVKPSTDLLRWYWSEIEALSTEGKIPFKQQELKEYFFKMEQQKFPPVHHSRVVMKTYKPAYRIIAKETVPLLQSRYP